MEPQRTSPAPSPPGVTRRRVLIVDDDAACCRALEEFLRHLGQLVFAFETFQSARAWLATSAPDAAVVDVRLGSYNGLQLIHLVREVNPSAVLVVMSGFDDAVLREDARSIGAAYLVKPLNLQALSGILGLSAAG